MIKIIIRNSGRIYCVRIEGHAGMEEAGRDIVCAGVSTVTYTMAEYIDFSSNVSCREVEEEASDGSFYMGCIMGDDKGNGEEKAREALTAIEQGYRLMAEKYPEYVKMEKE